MTSSSTERMLARTAIQTSRRLSALPRVFDRLRRHRLDVRDRALDRADDVGDGHLGGRAGEPVAAFGAAAGAHQSLVLQLQQDVLEELEGDVLGGREALSLDGFPFAGGGKLDGGADGVIGLG